MARKELSDKAKETARQYDNIHYSVIGSKLTREKADSFRNLCQQNNISVSSAISQFVQACILQGRIIDNFPQDPGKIQNDTPGTVDPPENPSN